jgi:hypothetical protein
MSHSFVSRLDGDEHLGKDGDREAAMIDHKGDDARLKSVKPLFQSSFMRKTADDRAAAAVCQPKTIISA